MDDFYALIGTAVAIIDLKGRILMAAGWQEICTKFHRVHPESRKNCIESDVYLSKNVEPGQYALYKCKNNMWDISTPIMVKDKHVGNLFLGQFFFEDEKPDYQLFEKQAHRYGFDKKQYLEALDKVPRWSREKVDQVMGFYSKFAQMISELGFSNINLSKMIAGYKAAKEQAEHNQEKFQSLFEDSIDGIYMTTIGGKYVDANSALVNMLGYQSKKELLAIDIKRDLYVSAADRPGPDDRNRTFGTRFKKKDGTTIDVEISSKVIYEQGRPKYYQGIVRDVTQRKKTEEKLQYLSFHDSLTGLYNRAYFDEELTRFDTRRQLPLSLIIGDVNGLKLVNDTHGHQNGDKLLRDVAALLKNYFREEDVIARWGGDEFCILLPKTSKTEAKKITDRIKKACREIQGSHTIPISIAFGVATKQQHGHKTADLLKEAEDHMYRNKLKEKGRFSFRAASADESPQQEENLDIGARVLRLRENAAALGKALNLSQSSLDALCLLVNLKDIGKLLILENLLHERLKLTRKEWEILKKHPEIGYDIAKSLPPMAQFAKAIRHHHEWWDGSGYPQGLKGREIHLFARIIAIVETYDWMRDGGPYKNNLGKKEALKELKRLSGSQLDPQLVAKFAENTEEIM